MVVMGRDDGAGRRVRGGAPPPVGVPGGRRGRLRARAVPRSAAGAARLPAVRAAERPRHDDPAGHPAAQPLAAPAGPALVGRAPRDPRRADRRARRRRRHDAVRHDPAPTRARERSASRVRLRLGGGGAGAPRRLGPDRARPEDPRRRGTRRADPGLRDGAVRHPSHLRARGRGGDRLPRRRVPVAHPGGVVRRAPVPVVGGHAGLRAGVPLAASHAATAPVAEAAAGRAAAPVRPQDAGAPRLPRRPCWPSSPTPTSCTPTAIRST